MVGMGGVARRTSVQYTATSFHELFHRVLTCVLQAVLSSLVEILEESTLGHGPYGHEIGGEQEVLLLMDMVSGPWVPSLLRVFKLYFNFFVFHS